MADLIRSDIQRGQTQTEEIQIQKCNLYSSRVIALNLQGTFKHQPNPQNGNTQCTLHM